MEPRYNVGSKPGTVRQNEVFVIPKFFFLIQFFVIEAKNIVRHKWIPEKRDLSLFVGNAVADITDKEENRPFPNYL